MSGYHLGTDWGVIYSIVTSETQNGTRFKSDIILVMEEIIKFLYFLFARLVTSLTLKNL